MELATALGASAMPFEQRETRLGEYDVVVCATSAPGTVIGRDAVTAAIHRRPARPLFFIDLALPRDVEAATASLQNVFLYNLDDLAKIADENRAARTAELAKCRALLDERAQALWRHVQSRLQAPAAAAEASTPREREKLKTESLKAEY
jgi:glutamyl-tRNA reductase